MNTYNDNLYASVVSSLNAQELQLNQKQTQYNSATFSLYYAEGALFRAGMIADVAQLEYQENLAVMKEAITVSDVSNSLLTTTKLANKYLGQSVNNMAVAAANVQVAANAIVLLASDIGSIYSIVNASNASTDINKQAETANELMDETAYLAEIASRASMEASQQTAEVAGSEIENKATLTNNSVISLYEIAQKDLKDSEAILATNNDAFATASAAEKVAEGNLEDTNVGLFASKSAYALSNDELNLNLTAEQSFEKGSLGLRYKVSFNYYKSPFEEPEDSIILPVEGYPVKQYYIFLVKNSSKSTFSIASAENLIAKYDDRWKMVPAYNNDDKAYSETTLDQTEILDTDGDEMLPGEEYVVFVLAELLDSYKKEINNFSDYMTAPTLAFKLTFYLNAAQNIEDGERKLGYEIDVSEGDKKKKIDIEVEKEVEQYLRFQVSGNVDIEYRCMFLPIYRDFVKGLLTNPELRNYEIESANNKEIEIRYDAEIDDTKEKIKRLNHKIELIDKKLLKNRKLLNKSEKDSDEYNKLMKTIEKNKSSRQGARGDLRSLKAELAELLARKRAEMLTSVTAEPSRCGFIFNLPIAEQVSFANYTLAKLVKSDKEKSESKPGLVQYATYEMVLKAETTDNYGNRLIRGEKYIPVVLSYSTAENTRAYMNALSDYDKTKSIVFSGEQLVEII